MESLLSWGFRSLLYVKLCHNESCYKEVMLCLGVVYIIDLVLIGCMIKYFDNP